ncbi:MAG TPA: DUF5916 domain-containing protein [Vicinamibacterales bacterium]|nr:DUF5916 domain-containing protein [Vicinamibacterales bacterium]
MSSFLPPVGSRRLLGLCVIALLGAHHPLHAEPTAPLQPARVSVPPRIDGVLDDEAWTQSPQVTGFKTWMPDYGREMGDQTIAWYAYDAENLYFAFKAFDREPGKIKASMASRDSIRPDDWICINLDSFNDQQALYAFYVNPLGIQMDSRYAAGRDDVGFDAVWYSAGRIDADGYTIELRIPFKSIRYSGGDPVTMSVVFERFVSRRREGGTWPALDPKAAGNFLIQGRPIVFGDIRHYKLLEVLPDATYSRHDVASGGRLRNETSAGDLGVSVKYGLTAQLTADGTYNPDFSQVEADAGQIDVNLRHALFFAEKRPFFLEGQEVFNLGGPAQHSTLQSIVYTRNIVNPVGGVKVSGKLAAADTFAALYAVDESGEGQGGATHAQFSTIRYKRGLNQDAYLGGFYAGREQGDVYNRVAGADGLLRLNQSTWFGFHGFGSSTRHEGDREGAAGHALGVDFTRETRRLTVYANAFDVSKTFAADSGYLTRNGVAAVTGYVAPRFYPRKGIVQRAQPSLTTVQMRDAYSGLWEGYNEAGLTLSLRRAASLAFLYNYSTEVFNGREFGTGGYSAQGSIQLTNRVRIQGSVTGRDAIYYAADPFGGRSRRGSLSVVYQPSDQWNQLLSLTYANFDRGGEGGRLYDYTIARSRTTFQLNRFLFFRGIVEYNSFRRELLTDLLASFTYIPGTVLHVGYGSLYERTRWNGVEDVRDSRLREARRGLFLKASYLWRL